MQIEVHILNVRGKERDFPKNGLRALYESADPIANFFQLSLGYDGV